MHPTPQRGAIDWLMGAVAALSRLGGTAAVALLLAAVVVISQMVFVRYVLRGSAIWQHELATFIGAPYVLLTRGHVYVDLVPHYLGGRARFVLALLAGLISLTFCATLAGYGFAFWYQAWANDWHAETVWRPPLWVPYFAVPLGMGLLALQSLGGIVALLTGRAAPVCGGCEPP